MVAESFAPVSCGSALEFLCVSPSGSRNAVSGRAVSDVALLFAIESACICAWLVILSEVFDIEPVDRLLPKLLVESAVPGEEEKRPCVSSRVLLVLGVPRARKEDGDEDVIEDRSVGEATNILLSPSALQISFVVVERDRDTLPSVGRDGNRT
jgi:hypothetical protein